MAEDGGAVRVPFKKNPWSGILLSWLALAGTALLLVWPTVENLYSIFDGPAFLLFFAYLGFFGLWIPTVIFIWHQRYELSNLPVLHLVSSWLIFLPLVVMLVSLYVNIVVTPSILRIRLVNNTSYDFSAVDIVDCGTAHLEGLKRGEGKWVFLWGKGGEPCDGEIHARTGNVVRKYWLYHDESSGNVQEYPFSDHIERR